MSATRTPTSQEAQADGPNAWFGRGYRREDLFENTCAVNSANSSVLDGVAAFGPTTETGQQMSCAAPTDQNAASRVGSGLAHEWPARLRSLQSSSGSVQVGPAHSLVSAGGGCGGFAGGGLLNGGVVLISSPLSMRVPSIRSGRALDGLSFPWLSPPAATTPIGRERLRNRDC